MFIRVINMVERPAPPTSTVEPFLMFSFYRISALTAVALLLISCGYEKESTTATEEDYSPYHDIPNADYAGLASCVECHEEQHQEWLQSDHHLAMNPATEEFVLGDFNDTAFEHFGQKFRFFKKGDEFWVNAPDADGAYKDMKVEYTFGHDPLQQYLIPFPGGRYQALQVCWDSRPSEEGGQRWYHLYPDEPVPPSDILHWTRRHFNWNYMCADCHSTNLDKNFDPETLTYDTTWSDMNVSCEACHGPASEHLLWANAAAKENSTEADINEADKKALTDYAKSKGLVVTLKEPEEAGWAINPETNLPVRTTPLKSNVQVESCARCHAHRSLNEPVYTAGQSFHDSHHPSVISDRLYHHDGQIDEEVYVYGSYVQSKMFHAGVRCSDCHNPHSMKLKLTGNALCLQCHQAEPFNTPAHHFHPVDSTGASCVECHMPHQTYMGVDDRRDHSIRIPQPALSKEVGSPDACTQCHTDKTQDWAAEATRKWWGGGPKNAHYGEILASANRGEPGSLERLIAMSGDYEQPAIARAAAVETLGLQAPGAEAISAIAARITDKDPEVRVQALSSLLPYPEQQRYNIAKHTLTDPVKSVRTEAVRILAAASSRFDEATKKAFEKAKEEFITKQKAISDRAGGYMGLALFYTDLGETEKAKAAYEMAKRVEPEFIPVRINLAETLFNENRPKEAEKEFRDAVDAAMIEGSEGIARDALARFLIRMKRYDEGLEELRQATELMPNHAQSAYFYGVALNSMGRFPDSVSALEKAIELQPFNIEYLTGAASIMRDGGKIEAALKYAKQALKLQPENPQLQQLVQSLGG